MKKVGASSGQSIFDVAIQEFGSIEAAFELAAANGLAGIDAELTPGQILEIDTEKVMKADVASYFSVRGIRLNSGIAPDLVEPEEPGNESTYVEAGYVEVDYVL